MTVVKSIEKRLTLLPRKSLSYLAVGSSAFYLLLCPFIGLSSLFAIVPFILMATKGVDVTFKSGILLSALWITYILLIVSPLFLIFGRFTILAIYIPIIGVVFFKEPHEPASWLFLTLEYVFWDIPLLIWIRIVSSLGERALLPFYSSITDHLVVGSIPLAVDVPFLVQQKIELVVNMCSEYNGPIEEYEKSGITQVHLPTPDVCEPKLRDILKGIKFIRTSKIRSKVFVHCKAGRGRAATFALCYLISTGLDPNDAMKLLKEKRAVIENSVLHFKVVEEFIQLKRLYLNDMDILLKQASN